MKIISQDSCRVTILFPLEEVVPLEGMNGPEAINKIQQRYEFLKTPDPAMTREEIGKVGYKFGTGQIVMNGKKSTIIEFAIYNDGIVADAKNSEIGETFLDDIIKFMQSEFVFRPFTTQPTRYFWNQMVVEFERPLERLLHSFNKISAAISRFLRPEMSMHFARIDFQGEKTPTPASVAPKFILERRAGIPFDKERYYSSAPIRTGEHITVLEEIERSIG
jgi:hypothetical protein